MYKKLIYSLLIGAFCSSLFASSFSHFMKPSSKKEKNMVYPNFSGHWEGNCESDIDDERFEKMDIHQDENMMSIIYDNGFGLGMQIDGYTRVGFQKQQQHVEAMLHVKWSDDGLQLLLKGISNIMSFMPKTELVTLRQNMSYQLKGEQLIITTDSELINPSIRTLSHEVCSMNRVN